MSRGALGWTLLVIALAVAVVGALAYLSPATPQRVTSPPARELAPEARDAHELAEAACLRVNLATQAIRANASAETVREELAAARSLAAAALRRDARFTALSGGVSALDEAVRRDEPRDAEVALKVTLRECEAAAN